MDGHPLEKFAKDNGEGRKIVHSCFLTMEGGSWTAEQLRQAAAAESNKDVNQIQAATGETVRWSGHYASAWGEVANNSGEFWKLKVMPVPAKGKKVVLCFPAGRGGPAWVTEDGSGFTIYYRKSDRTSSFRSSDKF